MILVLTHIQLKTPLQFFQLSMHAMRVVRQINDTPCIGFKKTGFWKGHYTMTLWRNMQEMQQFSRNGNHLTAVRASSVLAEKVTTLVLEANEFPRWREAKLLLRTKGKTRIYE